MFACVCVCVREREFVKESNSKEVKKPSDVFSFFRKVTNWTARYFVASQIAIGEFVSSRRGKGLLLLSKLTNKIE